MVCFFFFFQEREDYISFSKSTERPIEIITKYGCEIRRKLLLPKHVIFGARTINPIGCLIAFPKPVNARKLLS